MELDLRGYLDILKRHKWLIVEAAVVVALVAAVLTALRTPTYTATAKVLLRPNDPSETVDPGAVPRNAVDPDRNVSAQINIIQSEPVAQGAAKELKGTSPVALQHHLSVHQAGQNDILNVSGHDVDPSRARDVANAFAHAYIENRRQFAVGNLQQAADQIQAKLVQLQDRIAQLDSKIKDGGPATPGTANAVPTAPKNGAAAGGPTGPTSAVTPPDLSTGALPTDSETLVAARYAAQVQYQSLFQQQQDIAVDISLKRGEAELISEANTPTAPSSASAKRNGALGLVVGLLLGVAIALLREQLNDKIRSRRDAEEVTGLPVLAELPFDVDASQDEDWVSAADVPLGALAEAVRTLRTSLQFLSVDEQIRRIVVTSAGPGDGKSFVAANLAVVYAQAGLRTVLVSGDVRKPRLTTMFGISRSSRGLTDILADQSTVGRPVDDAAMHVGGHVGGNGGGDAFERSADWWEPSTGAAPEWRGSMALEPTPSPERRILGEALVPTRIPNLALLPAGPTPPNPAELLGSKRSAALLAELSRLADIVIIDTPPVLAVTDAAILAEQADGVLLVAALGETKKGTAERARSVLSTGHSRLLGVVLNKVEASQSYYYGYYGDGEKSESDAGSDDAKPKPKPKRKGREARRPLARRAG